MADKLSGKKVAILAADGFEEVELTKPRAALDEAGAKTNVVSLKPGKIQGMNHADKGETVAVDLTLDDAKPQDFDALLIPGGLMNPDTLPLDRRGARVRAPFLSRRANRSRRSAMPPGS